MKKKIGNDLSKVSGVHTVVLRGCDLKGLREPM